MDSNFFKTQLGGLLAAVATLAVTSLLTVSGLLTMGPSSRVSGNLIPTTDSTYDIGTDVLRWRNIYADNVDSATVTVSGAVQGALSVKAAATSDALVKLLNTDNTYGIEMRPGGSGLNNLFIGYEAGKNNTTGNNNLALGYHALYTNTTGTNNFAAGYSALALNTSGTNNFAEGYNSLLSNTTGSYNFATGFNSAYWNTSGSYNSAVGTATLYTNQTGSNNTASGYGSLYYALGSGNTASGYFSLFNTSSGAYNTALGYQAGDTNTSGSNNLFLGYNSDASANNLTNATAIGYNAVVGSSNSIVLGGTGASSVNVGIGTTTPSSTLHVNGSLSLGIRTVSATTDTVTATDDILSVTRTATGACTITLPTAQMTAGRTLIVKDAGFLAGTNNITIDTQGAEKIDNADTYVINVNEASVSLYSNGSGWFAY